MESVKEIMEKTEERVRFGIDRKNSGNCEKESRMEI